MKMGLIILPFNLDPLWTTIVFVGLLELVSMFLSRMANKQSFDAFRNSINSSWSENVNVNSIPS